MGEKRTYTAKITDHPRQEVDMETGEITMTETIVSRSMTVPLLENYVDIKLPRKFKFNNGGFITVFQKAIANIAMFGNLTKGEMQMLLYLIGTCGAANSVCIDLVKLSTDLKMSKGNASNALKGLVERNIVIRKDGYRYGKTPLPFELHLNFDQINYDLAYNGKIKEFKKHKVEHPMLMKSDGETPLLSKIKEASKELPNEADEEQNDTLD